MKNYYPKLIFFALLILGVVACKKVLEKPSPGDQTGTPTGTPSGIANRAVMANGNLITGFNVKWNKMPVMSGDFNIKIKNLAPGMLRYPGGTVANYWDWESGKSTDDINDPTVIAHKVQDAADLAYATGSKTIFVLNVLNYTTSDEIQYQINKLKQYNVRMNSNFRADDPNHIDQNYVEYIELGNEIYLGKYQTYAGFKTGAEYAKALIPWVEKIKDVFGTDCKIGVVLSAGPQISADILGQNLSNNKNVRKDTWNNGVPSDITSFKLYDKQPNGTCTPTIVDLNITVDRDDENENFIGVLPYINSHVNTLKNKIDAYIYHIYIENGECGAPTTAEARMSGFNEVRSNDAAGTLGKEIWVTEFGNQNDKDASRDFDLKELDKLTDSIYSNPDIKIALNQILVSSITGPTDEVADPALQLTGKLLSTGTYTTGGKYFLKRGNPVVFNKIYNSMDPDGENDAVELLVIQIGLDMRNLILKKFGNNGTTDDGVAYKFTSNSLWANLKSGTLIVIRNGTDGPPQDFDASDYTLNIDVNNTTYFAKGPENPGAKFDVSTIADMWMIKNPNFDASGNITGTTDGISNAIHTLAAGSNPSSFYNYGSITGFKLYSSASWGATPTSVYCKNPTSDILDYDDIDGTKGNAGIGQKTLGAGNNGPNGSNASYISQLQEDGW